jgi:hypothetical protein
MKYFFSLGRFFWVSQIKGHGQWLSQSQFINLMSNAQKERVYGQRY